MVLSGCYYPPPSCLDSTTDLTWLDWWQVWRWHNIPLSYPINITWRKERRMLNVLKHDADSSRSGFVGKGPEVTHQQCGGHRPRPTPAHLPGRRRPSLRWSAWAAMLPGHYNRVLYTHILGLISQASIGCLSYLSQSWGIAGREQRDRNQCCSSELSLSGLHLP